MKHSSLAIAFLLAGSTLAAADPPSAKLSDSDMSVVSELHHANQAEVEMGNYALSHGTKSVKDFATMMVKDHSANDTKLIAIAKKHGMTTIPVPPVDKAEMENMTKIEGMAGMEFDRAYIDAMVDGHGKVGKMVTDAIGTVADADLKAHLTATKPVVDRHLDSAKKLQKTAAQARN